MKQAIVRSSEAITLVGGGESTINDVNTALLFAPTLVAVDGGAVPAMDAGHLPEAVIGDFDSVPADVLAQIPQARRFHIAEQDTTDFDKALRSISAPLILAVGFTGARVDHQLAVLNVLVRRRAGHVLVIGSHEVIFHVPRTITLPTEAGDVVSLVPLSEVSGQSRGLEWPIEGIEFAPDGRIGSSNRALGEVHLQMDGPGMIGFIPRERLEPLVARVLGLSPDAHWSAPA